MNLYHTDGILPVNGEIFVFGSNLAGIHGAGAAKVAYDQFGAIWGQGQGLMGQSYGIATKDELVDTLPLDNIAHRVHAFVAYTNMYPHANFRWFVTRVGCGLAGYSDSQIAPMFKGAKNCSFAESWKPYLEVI